MNFLITAIATFFGTGLSPLAPGTVASLSVVILYKYVLSGLTLPFQAGIIVALFFLGVFSATHYARKLRLKDPGRIVIDEVCGQLTALIMAAPSWKTVLIGFFLFRFFDIIKPYPIKKLESLREGWGIMADDIGAGLVAYGFLRLILIFL